jgi:diguanylate cyclase (GGDEF)-like protein
MADGHQKLLSNSDSRNAIVARRRPATRPAADRRQEVALLRAANSRLRREVASLKEREAQAQRLADRDALTGLYNRRRMLELLESTIAEAEAQGQCVGLLFIDLNGFKAINDEYGHIAGDNVLTTAALRIAARVRAEDYVCRYGGDEFVVILPNVPSVAALTRVADNIRARMALPHIVEGREQHLTAAVGESLYPRDGDDAAQLLNRADQDMYRLKARLSRPMMSLGSMPQQRPSRRLNDKLKQDHSGSG